MIKEINQNEIDECVNVIRESFLTVANDLALQLKMLRDLLRLRLLVKDLKR